MLNGEKKKAYQREYMREWQRKHRSKQIGLNNINGSKHIKVGSNSVSSQGLTSGSNKEVGSNQDITPKKKWQVPISMIDAEGKEHRINYYGCGCIKDEKPICDRHNRG